MDILTILWSMNMGYIFLLLGSPFQFHSPVFYNFHYRESFIFLVKFVPRYFIIIFEAIVNSVALLISFWAVSLSVYKNYWCLYVDFLSTDLINLSVPRVFFDGVFRIFNWIKMVKWMALSCSALGGNKFTFPPLRMIQVWVRHM